MIVGIIAYYGRIFMKLYAALLLFITTAHVYPMQSPGREKEGKLTDSQHVRRSSKNLNLLQRAGSGSPTSSPSSSKIEHKSPPISPEKGTDKKGSEIRRGSAALIEQGVEAFASPGLTEEELQKKFEEAKKKLIFSRDDHDNLLKEILEARLSGASAARHQAALALFDSAKAQVDIAIGNVKAFELYKNPLEAKMALRSVLIARNLAAYAVAKKICAVNPRKYEEWCRFEEETDPTIMALNKTINEFFSTKTITEEMKTKEVPRVLTLI
jgi:hypothetical protein